ncbi:MAG TPA: efflux RND transporter permease subunit [Candidatus Paceibacterota bacterium]|nr:efflux RND transporter permease subunit [Candidatus Paceibacterota bacterium]
MWEFFIRNNRFTYLILLALIALGTYSVLSIPKESSPEVVIPVGIVTTSLFGAPAADIESLITNEIERGLSNLDNVSKITSTSRESVSTVIVEFEAEANLDKSIRDLKDAVDTIKRDLPTDAEEPFVSEVNFVDQPILTIAVSLDISDTDFTALAKKVETAIESVSGVSRVVVSGVRDREVTVIVDQAALQRYSISLNTIINAIRNANQTLPIGQIENDGVSYNVAFEGDIKNSTQIRDIAVGSLAGQPVFLRDVATVEDGLAAATTISRLSVAGEPSLHSVSFDVYKRSGGDITVIAKDVNSLIEGLKDPGEILAGAITKTILDSGDQIRKDLIRLSSSGFQTVLLVLLLLVFAIGWREGLLAGLAIPLSFLFGFIGLYFSGNTINFLSLFALILGIGILVDSAIVIVEGINRKMKDSPQIDKREAAILVTKEFSSALISGTLTTVSMFAGLFIVGGVIGQFISSIPFTLIFLLFASLFVSLAMLPLFAATILKRRSATVFEQKQVEYAHVVESKYKKWLESYLSNPDKQDRFLAFIFALLVFSLFLAINLFGGLIAGPLTYYILLKLNNYQRKKKFGSFKRSLIFVPAVVIISVAAFFVSNTVTPTLNLVKVTFFAQSDVDFVIIEVESPEGTTKEVTDIGVRRAEEVLYQTPEIDSFTVTVGNGSQFGSGGTGGKLANIFVNLKLDRERTSTEIVEDLRSQFSVFNDIKITVNQPSEGPPTGAAIIVKFLGDDLNEITRLANEAAQIFKSLDNAVNVETSTNNNSTEFVLELDREKAAALGLNPFTISQIARTAVFGTEATSLTTPDEDIKVVVKLNIGNNDEILNENANVISINDLSAIAIPTPNGNVPLAELVTISLRESSSVINHEERKRVVTVTADVTANGNVRDIQAKALERINAELDIPSGVIISTGGGETDESNKAFLEMLLALIVGIILMVGVLTLQFNSYLHMRYVLSILPYSLIGILIGLAATQSPLSFPSIMGFIALSGIVVNNAILLIDSMNQMRRSYPEMNIKDVVLNASTNRLRPILLTTITTVVGMVPLIFAGELWAPLAYAVMFGLAFSVVITLILVPIIYNRRPGEVLS